MQDRPMESVNQNDESTLTDLDFILQQVAVVFKDKFESNIVMLSGKLTSSEFSELNTEIESNILAWRTTTFAEYKVHYDKAYGERKAEDDVDAEKLNQLVEDAFYSYRKQNGPKWSLVVEFIDETPALIDFVAAQLNAKRLSALGLKQTFSAGAIDRIIQACKYTSLGKLSFVGAAQKILDHQASALLKYITAQRIEEIFNLSGKEISDETAEQFSNAAEKNTVTIIDCPHFDTRRRVKQNIRFATQLPEPNDIENYRAEDIKQWTQRLTNLPDKIVRFDLKANFLDPEWGRFFASVLSSRTNVTALTISKSAIITDDILEALLASLILNTTLTLVHLVIENQQVMTNVVQALSAHPALTELVLSGSNCTLQGPAFQSLLIHTKKLQSLNLKETKIDDNTILGLVSGLKVNDTLMTLYLPDHELTPAVLKQLTHALSFNQSLTQLAFKWSSDEDDFSDEMQSFLLSLQLHNHSLINININFSLRFSSYQERQKENKELLSAILARNKKFSLEKRQQQRQFYVEAAIVLLQALRAGHRVLSSSFVFDSIIFFLAPLQRVASVSETKRCTDLLRFNLRPRVDLRKRQWLTGVEEKIRGRFGEEQICKFTIFKKWPEPDRFGNEFKHEITSEESNRAASAQLNRLLERRGLKT